MKKLTGQVKYVIMMVKKGIYDKNVQGDVICILNANGDIIGFNMFAYCGNEPVMESDSSGTQKDSVPFLGGAYIGAYLVIDYQYIPYAGHALLLYESEGIWYKTQFCGSQEAVNGCIMYSLYNIYSIICFQAVFGFGAAVSNAVSLSQIGTTIAEKRNKALRDGNQNFITGYTAIKNYIHNNYPETTSDVIGLQGDFSKLKELANLQAGYC